MIRLDAVGLSHTVPFAKHSVDDLREVGDDLGQHRRGCALLIHGSVRVVHHVNLYRLVLTEVLFAVAREAGDGLLHGFADFVDAHRQKLQLALLINIAYICKDILCVLSVRRIQLNLQLLLDRRYPVFVRWPWLTNHVVDVYNSVFDGTCLSRLLISPRVFGHEGHDGGIFRSREQQNEVNEIFENSSQSRKPCKLQVQRMAPEQRPSLPPRTQTPTPCRNKKKRR